MTWKDSADPAAFAKLALAYAKENGIAAVASEKAESETVVFTGLDLGYYLVDSSLGALCALNTTKHTAEVNEKNSAPTLEKKVLNGTAWVDSTTANRGEEVNFLITVTVGKGAENYTIHDYMNGELKFKEIKSVKLNETVVSSDSYQLVTAQTCGERVDNNSCTFEIQFTKGVATIDGNKGSLVVDSSDDTRAFAIVNNTGAELPSTGGIGTTIFYVVGGILMLGAAVILVTRKKVSSSK